MFKNLIVTAVATVGLFAGLPAPASDPNTAPPAPTRAAWLYVTPVTDTGWTHQHELGRRAVEQALGPDVQTQYIENVAEGPDAERVLRDLARQGVDIIFTTSFGYMEPVLKVAREFPAIRFETITGIKRAANVATANARYYEGRYLSGVAAGLMTESGVVGYVAGFPIPEIVSSINAFTQGLRSVKPAATVKLIWLNEWYNPPREREAAMALMDQGADVLAFNSASTAVMRAAQERKRLAIAYHSDMRPIAPDAQLAAVTHHWDAYATERVRALRQGRWQSSDHWGGVAEGMVRIEAFGPRVPQSVQMQVLQQQQDLVVGRIHPFAGPLIDSKGQTRVPAGEVASDAHILSMDYLVQGVQGALP